MLKRLVVVIVFIMLASVSNVSAQPGGSGSEVLTGDFGEIVGGEVDNASPVLNNAFSGQIIFIDGNGNTIVGPMPTDAYIEVTRSGGFDPTNGEPIKADEVRIGMCAEDSSDDSVEWLQAPSAGCIDPENGKWSSGITSFEQGFYSIRAFSDGAFHHPLRDVQEHYYQGSGSLDVGVFWLYSLDVRVENVSFTRLENNLVEVSGVAIHNTNFIDKNLDSHETLGFYFKIIGPSQSKDYSTIVPDQFRYGVLYEDSSQEFTLRFYIPWHTGIDGYGELCARLEVFSYANPQLTYYRGDVCIPADMPNPPVPPNPPQG